MGYKRKEEQRPAYKEISETTVRQCLVDVELMQTDPGGYCFQHCYPQVFK